MDVKIAILLPTYNSEKYLREQIDSLILQSYSNWHLWVRDDGSSDSTLSILDDYWRQIEGKITIVTDTKGNLGTCRSFETLMEYCSGDYLMFCDHDDVWLPNKIEETLTTMIGTEAKYKNLPILVCTDLQVVDEKLNVINSSMWNYMRNKPVNTRNIYELAVNNYVTGCTVMINRLAKDCSIPFDSKAFMHDWWIALNVCKKGIIVALFNSTILYRQHQSNTLGTYVVDGRYFVNRLLSIKNIFKHNKTNYTMFKTVYPDFSQLILIYTKIKVVLRKMLFSNYRSLSAKV